MFDVPSAAVIRVHQENMSASIVSQPNNRTSHSSADSDLYLERTQSLPQTNALHSAPFNDTDATTNTQSSFSSSLIDDSQTCVCSGDEEGPSLHRRFDSGCRRLLICEFQTLRERFVTGGGQDTLSCFCDGD